MQFTRQSLIAAYHAHSDRIAYDSVPADLAATLTPAAVLIPVIERPDGLGVLLTQRSDLLKNHAGQISFPGGRYDEGDESLEQTALRETAEEIGLLSRHIELIGPIATYATVSKYVITPFLALVSPDFKLCLQTEEVADTFEAPLDHLLNPTHHVRREVVLEGRRRIYYEISWQGWNIWGATAAMLRNLGRQLSPERYL